MVIRPFLFAALLPVTLLACGGGGDSVIVPTGMHTHYVVNKIQVPTNNTQSRDFGLDLNGDKTVDNQLGMVLGTLAGQGVDVQTSVDSAVAKGSIILLADVQTADFMSSSAAGFQLFLGDTATAMPKPCTDAADMTCGHHLTGTGMFSIAANSPNDAALTGKIIGGTFTTATPGDIQLQISLGGMNPVSLSLIGARIQASGMSATGVMSAILAGAITQDDLNNHVLPAVHDNVLLPILAKDCPGATAADAPGCKCVDGSGGKQVISLLDTSPADCTVTLDEIKNNGLFSSLLAPDVMLDVNGVLTPALSLGLKATAVAGTFTQPTP